MATRGPKLISMGRKLYWTTEKLKKEALKYDTPQAFNKGNSSAYSIAASRGLLEDICSHMTRQITKRTDEQLFQVARKYFTKGQLRSKDKGAYLALHRRGLINEACSHMPEHAGISPDVEHFLYTYVTATKFAYVGITTSLGFRTASHANSLNEGLRWISKHGHFIVYGACPGNFNTTRTFTKEVAHRFEPWCIRKKQQQGWKMLNKMHNPDYCHATKKYSFDVPF